jgi:hypothetical protein
MAPLCNPVHLHKHQDFEFAPYYGGSELYSFHSRVIKNSKNVCHHSAQNRHSFSCFKIAMILMSVFLYFWLTYHFAAPAAK